MNSIAEAKQQAAEELAKLLAEEAGPDGFVKRLVQFATIEARSPQDGFFCRLPRVARQPQADPTWLPVAPPEIADRLAVAGLIRHDEAVNAWVWSNDWFGALLVSRELEHAGPEELQAWLKNSTSKTAVGALALLANQRIDGGATDRTELQPFLTPKQGVEAFALALALRAPVEPEVSFEEELCAFSETLDAIFGSPHELERPPARLAEIRILDGVQVRLAEVVGARSVRRLLGRRILHLNRRVLEMEPQHAKAYRTIAGAHALLGDLEDAPLAALEEWTRAIAALEPLALVANSPADHRWTRDFLSDCCRKILNAPCEGDLARRREVYAMALRALSEQQHSNPPNERDLCQQIRLLGLMLDLELDGGAVSSHSLFETCRERIDQLILLAPTERLYRDGRLQLLREYAECHEAAEPELAATLREEADRIARTDAEDLPATDEETRDEPSVRTDPAQSPDSASPVAARLHEWLRAAGPAAAQDPSETIEAAQRALSEICRAVAEESIGYVPGHPSPEQLASWLSRSGILPGRLAHAVQVVHLGAAKSGKRAGLHCHAAISRLARWYWAVHLRLEPTPEVTFKVFPRSVRGPVGVVGRPALTGAASGSRAPRPQGAGNSTATVDARRHALNAPRETELGKRQRELAHELGLPVTLEDPLLGISLLLIPGGEYWMGADPSDGHAASNERPQLRIRLRPFYCAIAPVLQEEWERLVEVNGSEFRAPRLPVTNISWSDAQNFLERANHGRQGPPLRLLSEAEWEYATRAGTTTPFWWGSAYRSGQANCSEGGLGSGRQATNPPGDYPPNPFGLFDLLGNVWEWCEDSYSQDLKGQSLFGLPRTGQENKLRTLRGGGWTSLPGDLRASRRRGEPHAFRSGEVGFRCGMSLK